MKLAILPMAVLGPNLCRLQSIIVESGFEDYVQVFIHATISKINFLVFRKIPRTLKHLSLSRCMAQVKEIV